MKIRRPYTKLFETLQLGNMPLRNRIVMPAMLTNYCDSEGYVNDRMTAYYEERAKGGVALVIAEPSYVHPRGRIRLNQPALYDDRFISQLFHLAQSIQRHGAKAAIQLHHGGKRSRSEVTGTQPLGPSSLPSPGMELPKEMTLEEIEDVVASFAKAARIAKEAGFDALEISATTGGLLGQFISRANNKRADRYGGDLRNRSRFLTHVIEAVRCVVGAGYPILCRINAKEEETVKEGITLEESKEVSKILEQVGVSAVHVYVDYDGSPLPVAERPLGKAMLLPLAADIKQTVRVPVIAVGRISPEAGERALIEQNADLIAMGKALIADPELPNKAKEDRLDEIKPCIVCLRCIDNVRMDKIMECTVNARAGHELELALTKTDTPRKVLVVGGGPAGMEAAQVAAFRGHKVTLFEKASSLGGAMVLAAVVNPDLEDFLTYMTRTTRKSPIEIKLRTEATGDAVDELKPDVIIIAAGGSPAYSEIPFNDHPVLTSSDIMKVLSGTLPNKGSFAIRFCWWVASIFFRYFYRPAFLRTFLRLPFPIGRKVVIIGGDFAGGELGLTFLSAGKKVTVIEESSTMLSSLGPTIRSIYLAKLEKYGAKIEAGAKVIEFTQKGVKFKRGDSEEFAEADTVAFAKELDTNGALAHSLQGKGCPVHEIGDCAKPARIMEAIASGFRIAREI